MKRFFITFLLFLIIVLFISYISTTFLIKKNNETLVLNGEGTVVLCYHRVLPEGNITNFTYEALKKYTNDDELKLYSVSGYNFEKQIKYLKENNIKILSLEQLENYFEIGSSLPDKSVVITFDDVDESIYKIAFPILKKYEVPFSAFVITGQVGNKNFKGLKLASWEQIKEMTNSGLLTLGLHSHNLHFLDKQHNPPFMNQNNINAFYTDTQMAIETFEKNTEMKAKFYSYPYGFGTPETDEYLMKSGIKLLFSLKPGVVSSKDPMFFIKRILIDENNWGSVKEWLEQK